MTRSRNQDDSSSNREDHSIKLKQEEAHGHITHEKRDEEPKDGEKGTYEEYQLMSRRGQTK
jgi:hypothetical protein